MSRDLIDIRDRLQRHLVDGDKLKDVVPLVAGHTNETYRLDGLAQVLRMPPAGAPLLEGFNMGQQFQLYAVLGRLAGGPPVPRVTYYCEDNSIIGAPFFLMECVEGASFPEYDQPEWFTDPPDSFRQDLCRQWVGAIASLSRLPLIQMLGPTRSGPDELALWRGHAERAGADRLVAMIDRLIAMGARSSGPACIVHGDPKLGNTLWQAGRLQAVLDWEMASNGEPLNDLGYMLYFFPSSAHPAQVNCDHAGMWTREQIVSEWERLTGRSAQGCTWYEAAGAAKIAAIIAYGHHLSLTGKSDDARMAAWGPSVEAGIANVEMLIESIGRD